MNINSMNIHYVAIQAHTDKEDKAVWTIIGHCLYSEDARQIVRDFNAGDAGRLYCVTESVLDSVREHGGIIKNVLLPVEEVTELASGIDQEAFYLVHRENVNGKTTYRIIMTFTDAMNANLFCYVNYDLLGSDFLVLTGEQLKTMTAQENAQENVQENAITCNVTIDNPVFRMTVANMLASITNIAYDDVVHIIRNTNGGLLAVARMTADEIMDSEYPACCVLAITVGEGEHRVIIA